MFTITIQDLRFRARQFLIAVVGAGLVFAMTLLLSGLAAGFHVEVIQTVEGLGAQSWAIGAGSAARDHPPSPLFPDLTPPPWPPSPVCAGWGR